MRYYFCACPACTWKGNKPHRDGQCPVCGNALEIQIRERRHSADLASKVVLSGLSTDRKFKAPLPDFSMLKDYRFSEAEVQALLKAGESIRSRIGDTVSKLNLADKPLKSWLAIFHDEN
ncbi:MAG: hypothetical protein ACU843_18145 [Gammaproteobacteria bacterium]